MISFMKDYPALHGFVNPLKLTLLSYLMARVFN